MRRKRLDGRERPRAHTHTHAASREGPPTTQLRRRRPTTGAHQIAPQHRSAPRGVLWGARCHTPPSPTLRLPQLSTPWRRHVVMCARSKTCKRAPISKRRKTEQVGTLKVPPNPPHPIVSNQHENGPAAPPPLPGTQSTVLYYYLGRARSNRVVTEHGREYVLT